MVLIPKGGEDYRSICLMEVIWKAVAVILNCRFTAGITYHGFLHVFRVGSSMGTATLKHKMSQQVAALREAVFHAIFMELHKAYNALDRSRCMRILEGCGVGPRALRLL